MSVYNYDDLVKASILKSEAQDPFMPVTDVQAPESSFSAESFGRAIATESPVVQALEYNEFMSGVSPVVDPFFNASDAVEDMLEGLDEIVPEEQLQHLIRAKNQEEFDAIVRWRDKEISDREMVAESGMSGLIGSFIGANISPMAVLGGFFGVAAKSGKALSAFKGGGITAGVATVDEIILQQYQTERPTAESLLNVAASSTLGAILGGFAGGMSQAQTRAVKNNLTKIMDEDTLGVPGNIQRTDDSVGALSNRIDYDLLKKEEGAAKLPDWMIKASSFIPFLRSPVVKGLVHGLGTVRAITNQLFDHNIILGKEFSDDLARSAPVRALIDQELTIRLSTIKKDMDSLLKESKMKEIEFNRETYRKLLADEFDQSPAGRAAKILSAQFEELADDLVGVKILDPERLDIKTAKKYFPRAWDRDKIIVGRKRFKEKLRNHVKRYDRDMKLRKTPLSNQEADDLVEEIYDTLTTQTPGTSNIEALAEGLSKGTAGFTKGRVLMVKDEDFLEFFNDNIMVTAEHYINQAVSMKHFKKYLDDQGLQSAKELDEIIIKEYETKLENTTDPAEIRKLEKDLKDGLDLLHSNVRLVLGIIKRGNKAVDKNLALLRKYQFITKLGGVAITSLVELAMPIFRFSLGRTMSGWARHLSDLSSGSMTRKDIRTYIQGYDNHMNHIHRVLTEPGEKYVPNPDTIYAYADKVSDFFGNVSLINPWTDLGRTNTAFIAQRRLAEFVRDSQAGKLSKVNKGTLRSLGISKEMEPEILKQLNRANPNWQKDGYLNLQVWEPEIRKSFANSVYRDIDNTILVPRKGDIPKLIQESSVGATLFQFRAFSSNATTRVLLSGTQRLAMGDANALFGLMSLVMAGASVYVLKARLNGQKPNLDPETLITEGIMRSGVAGLFWENALALAPGITSSKYAHMNALGIFLGPSFGTASDVVKSYYGLTDGEVSDADMRRLLRLAPFNNIFYLKELIKKALDIEEKP